MKLESNRLAFADLLRGLAALVVVLGHFIVLYLKGGPAVAKLIMAEPIPAVPFPAAVDAAYAVFNLAWIGVAVFFLISGFVILLSLDGAESRAFLVKRLFRIFPTYWVALATGVAALFVSAAFWSKPVTHTGLDYFANALLIPDFFGRFDIPTVMWTLEVEVKFYLLAPLFHASLKRGSLRWLFVWGAGVAAAYWLAMLRCDKDIAECWTHSGFIRLFAWEAMFITYMLIGSVVYAHYRKLVTTRQAAVGIVALFTCFVVSWPLSSWAFIPMLFVLAYFWGIVIFTALYLCRDKITLTRPFRFLADISYPLYVVHPLVGYVAMRLLMAAGLPYPPSFAIALALVIGIATLMHVYVEAPSMALGKKLAARLSRAGRQRRPAFRGSLPEALPPAGAPGAGEASPVLERV